jgi:hypothetical protein
METARLNKSPSVNAELKEALAAWGLPAALELLKGTPINCLIVNWASGESEDSVQQQALWPLIEAGRRMDISFVGKITVKDGLEAAVAAGRAAGLSAVMLENAPGNSPLWKEPALRAAKGGGQGMVDLPVILQSPRDKVVWEATSPVFSSTDNVWPGVGLDTMKGDTAIAGPTGIPWVNSNGWFSLLTRALAPGKTLWLDVDPPDSARALHPETYCLAVADSRAYGCQWIISLDDRTRMGILKKDPKALDGWAKICATLSFFESHREWATFQSLGVLAVISDFRGENTYLSGEVLNLLNRRQVQFLVMDRPQALAEPIAGLRALLWLDKEPPSPAQLSRLLAFVRQGGLVMAATYWGPPGLSGTEKDWLFGYKLYNVGQGQIVVPEAGFQDPYQVAVDSHLLVSRRNDFVRLFNPASTNCYSSVDAARKKRLVQVLNYSSSPASYMTLWVNTRIWSGRLWNPEAKDSSLIRGVAVTSGTEFQLPTIPLYCALELEVRKTT